jgi:microcystin-dependent protein
MFAGNFAPRSWALCDGQLLAISQNDALFSLLGTTYGGDGRTTFALPDLRGRVPIHVGASVGGTNHALGQKAGEETHTVSVNEMPTHTHTAQASSDTGNTPIPTGNALADSAPTELYHGASSLVDLGPGTIADVGGGQAHNNMQPFITLNFCIALQGIFPPRN